MPRYELARKLRRQLTPPEFLLWDRLKTRGPGQLVFHRQYAMGDYILDFYCKRAKLCVEVDGHHHTQDDRIAKDAVRDAWLRSRGIEVYRIPAGDVFEDADEAADGIILLAEERLSSAAK